MKMKVTVDLEVEMPDTYISEENYSIFLEDSANDFVASKAALIKIFKEDWQEATITEFEFTRQEVELQ